MRPPFGVRADSVPVGYAPALSDAPGQPQGRNLVANARSYQLAPSGRNAGREPGGRATPAPFAHAAESGTRDGRRRSPPPDAGGDGAATRVARGGQPRSQFCKKGRRRDRAAGYAPPPCEGRFRPAFLRVKSCAQGAADASMEVIRTTCKTSFERLCKCGTRKAASNGNAGNRSWRILQQQLPCTRTRALPCCLTACVQGECKGLVCKAKASCGGSASAAAGKRNPEAREADAIRLPAPVSTRAEAPKKWLCKRFARNRGGNGRADGPPATPKPSGPFRRRGRGAVPGLSVGGAAVCFLLGHS